MARIITDLRRPRVPGLHLKRGIYYFQPRQIDGFRPSAISLHTSDFATAVAALDQIRRSDFVRDQQEPLASLIPRYLSAKRAAGQHRGRSSHNASNGLKRLSAWIRIPIDQIDETLVEKWRDSLLAEGLSRATVAGYVRYAASFFSWALNEGLIYRHPCRHRRALVPKRLPTRRDRWCPADLRDRLITGCSDLEMRAVLLFGFHAGLRRGEILALRPHWIERHATSGRPHLAHIQNDPGTDRGVAHWEIKDGDARRVPLSSTLVDFLESPDFDLPGRLSQPYLIAPRYSPGKHTYRWEWKRSWKSYMRRMGCPWVTPHVMRHTFVTLLLSAPPDRRPSLLHVSRWTGTGLETLEKSYAHLIEDEELINASL